MFTFREVVPGIVISLAFYNYDKNDWQGKNTRISFEQNINTE